MAQKEPHSKAEQTWLPHLTPTGLAAMGEKRMEEFAKAQDVLFSTLQESHRRCLDRMQSEARLASEWAHRVTNARSIPDAVAACQEWTSRQFEMMADDGIHLLADSQKVVETGARFLSNGLLGDGPGAGTAVAGDRIPLHTPSQTGPAQAGATAMASRQAATSSDSVAGFRSGREAAAP
jgi:hypothetical protein